MRNLDQIIERLFELKDQFQEIGEGYTHDDIYIQIIGIDEMYDEIKEDKNLLIDINEMVKQLEESYKALYKLREVNWIFA